MRTASQFERIPASIRVTFACFAASWCSCAPIVLAATPPRCEVAVVQATISAPNKGEQRYAESLVRNLTRWLTELDVTHKVLTDEQVTPQGLNGLSIAILPYNPNPPAGELNTLRRFVATGGRLIVCYSQDPVLAEIMHVKLGPYIRAEKPGRWSVMHFNRFAPGFTPDLVHQRSQNIRPVYPIRRLSRVIATWKSDPSAASAEPAWVHSRSGFWMSHVLLNDGDSDAKKQMLLGLLGTYAPDIWQAAARRRFSRAQGLGGSAGYTATVKRIRDRAATHGRSRQAAVYLARADKQRDHVLGLIRGKQFPRAYVSCQGLEQTLMQAYGAAHPPRAGEFRGLWNHSGTGIEPYDWEFSCRVVKESGFTDIFAHVLSPGMARYPTRLAPREPATAALGDQLKACLDAAGRHQLRVHAWVVCWNLYAAPPETVERYRESGRLQRNSAGNEVSWLCPSNPKNRELQLDMYRELLKKYPVDGLHLDYIRLPDSAACFCPGCRRRFEADSGRKVGRWPQEASEGSRRKAYDQWRCDQITAFVRDVKKLVDEVRPRAELSAAVYGKYPSCRDSVAQDWPVWVREGLVDFLCPMNYLEDMQKFRIFTAEQMDLQTSKVPVYPGIGATAIASQLDAAEVIDQVMMTRQLGARGFMVFDLNPNLNADILPVLKLGVTGQ